MLNGKVKECKIMKKIIGMDVELRMARENEDCGPNLCIDYSVKRFFRYTWTYRGVVEI